MTTAVKSKIRKKAQELNSVDCSSPSQVRKKGYTIEEVREMGYDLLSELYGVDIRKL